MGRDGQGHDRLGGSIQSPEARRLSSCREPRNPLARRGYTRSFDRTELGRNERCPGEGGRAVAETTKSSGRQLSQCGGRSMLKNTRRDFIKQAALGTAALMAYPPGRVLGANERIRLG